MPAAAMMNPADTTPVRVLMADDEEIYLKATGELLRLKGFDVTTASDGFRAMELLRAQSYDVLVSDIRMPGNEGLEFIQEAGSLSPRVPVILVTGHPSVATATKAIHLPVAAYLTKPVDIEELAAEIRRVATQHRAHLAIGRSRGRLSTWIEDLDQLHRAPDGMDADITREVLGLTIENMAGMLMDMKALFEMTLASHPHGEPPCAIRACPRLETYKAAVQESIQVLDQTRHAFKSKELGRLREKLESIQPD
jgi:DNA-binding response OmpR family regulator